jgi:uncharacterized MnhB-related membrane protein
VSALQASLFIGWAIVGTIVVLVRDAVRQTVLVGIMGLIAGLAFFAVQAPDVALSMIVVGAIALPALILLALGRMSVQDTHAEDEEPRR